MGNETLLPKNIRQIGDIQGRIKICLEDYVVTYIRKREKQGGNFLGVFLGDRKQTKDAEYVYVRGILEAPQPGAAKDSEPKKRAEGLGTVEAVKSPEAREASKNGKAPGAVRLAGTLKMPGALKALRVVKAPGRVKASKISSNTAPKTPRSEATAGAHEPATPLDPWACMRREQEMYFPGWGILGCCVIGTYPTKRMEELTKNFPESGKLLYHLQDQEERLYQMEEGRYEGIRGYFVFYEQNRRMQEYLAEVFGEQSVEKEAQPDRAIKTFRAKVRDKGEYKSRSFLKLASSFFVVTVLLVGAIVVNRVEDLREAQNAADMAAALSGQETAAYNSGTQASDVPSSKETQADFAEMLTAALPGSDAFWEDDETDAVSGAAVSEATNDQTADTDASEGTVAVSGTDAVSSADGSDDAAEASAADTASAADSDVSDTTASAAGSDVSDTTASAADPDTSPETAEAVSRQVQAAYVIREGDTLAAICQKYYGSLERLEELCETNEIEDADRILPGQKIVLP